MPLTDGLVLYLPFQGTVIDSSGAGNDFSLVGGPSFAAGKIGQCLSLNGTSQYATRASSATFQGGLGVVFTGCCWVKFNSIASTPQWIFNKGGNGFGEEPEWAIYLESVAGVTQICFVIKSPSGLSARRLDSGVTPVVGQWYFVAFGIRDDGRAWLQVDCAARGVDTSDFWTQSTTRGIYIGVAYRPSAGTYHEYLNGSVDDARFWTRSLSDVELGQLCTVEDVEADTPPSGFNDCGKYIGPREFDIRLYDNINPTLGKRISVR